MNYREISSFVGAWQQTGLYEQRIGWLYGYYSEDPNFPEGIRVNVEAIYEPPQIGDNKGVQPLEDPFRQNVDMLAESLGLERVGVIFTSLNQEKLCMTSD
jgi:nuclear protein localization family protein 4